MKKKLAATRSKEATGKGERPGATPSKSRPVAAKPVLLAGGNPQIAKADGDAPVEAYLAALPGWKRHVGRRLDALIVRNVPNVRKAVKWNSPFYGIDGQGWFLALHVFTRYVKVTFFRGTSLRPVPSGGRSKEARWVDIHEGDLEAAQMEAWIKQASSMPGCKTGDGGWQGENMKKPGSTEGQSPSELIDKRVAELGDWRGAALSRMRELIKEAAPGVVEEWKWMGTPVWSRGGIICTGETYKSIVKFTFTKGASLKDPAKLFNSSLDGNARRAIDIHEGEVVDAAPFKALVRDAVVLNASASTAKSQRVKEATGAERRRGRAAGRRHARGSAPFRTPRK